MRTESAAAEHADVGGDGEEEMPEYCKKSPNLHIQGVTDQPLKEDASPLTVLLNSATHYEGSVEVKRSADKGHYCIAKKAYKKGDVVAKCLAESAVLYCQYLAEHCSHCFSKLAGVRKASMGCRRCRRVFYCSRLCQMADHKFHDQECHLYVSKKKREEQAGKGEGQGREESDMSAGDADNKTADLMALCKEESLTNTGAGDGGQLQKGKGGEGFVEDVNLFLPSDIRQLARFLEIRRLVPELSVVHMYLTHREWDGKAYDASNLRPVELEQMEHFKHHLCVLRNNRHSISHKDADGTSTTVGIGFTSFGSMFNHSCRPNLTWAWKGRQLTMSATRDIQPEEELTITYTKLSETVENRRARLKRGWNFHCRCPRCIEEEKEASHGSQTEEASGGAATSLVPSDYTMEVGGQAGDGEPGKPTAGSNSGASACS
eukprot:CAMPEP_0177676738 /NCGR_PEP_ID=MMETSP0447-20121125/27975_1 /TAXON_ID=0 /ORGANISM="Stygamoeba regulata, Strain BSH-02190019" /LENGTH=431 /DNA_ID=CAMNT_0019185373 /DNA_START=33 /DNA_END=1328 /DNA_ORIENTATION=-